MIDFYWPWLFIILPLPLLVRALLPAAADRQDAALRVPFLDDFETKGESLQGKPRRLGLIWLAALTWVLLTIAAARPQWLGDPLELPMNGRDLMLAVDLSGSMQEEDFQLSSKWVDRLTATKAVAGEFIERRKGDRIGLILFGERAYLQTPLTFDRQTVKTLLYESAIGLAGKKTAIGDAIGLAIKRLQDRPTENRVLILLTDGANTAGEIEPIRAAELAARKQVKVYTIGIGADEMVVRSFFGTRKVNPSRDLDEKALTAIAEKTGGRYFRARDTAELTNIYHLLDELEPVEQEQQLFRPVHALYPWPLGAALVLAGIIAGAGAGWRRKNG
ncbi:Aerotolerance protein BatA [hydrothermal vent metagenome]|uniref:Aerotolerance protein BatA n=1 Tax=hydrothermal vent metagenome TaxID=652676 RepID=A0A3B1BIC4_9ZZZZ